MVRRTRCPGGRGRGRAGAGSVLSACLCESPALPGRRRVMTRTSHGRRACVRSSHLPCAPVRTRPLRSPAAGPKPRAQQSQAGGRPGARGPSGREPLVGCSPGRRGSHGQAGPPERADPLPRGLATPLGVGVSWRRRHRRRPGPRTHRSSLCAGRPSGRPQLPPRPSVPPALPRAPHSPRPLARSTAPGAGPASPVGASGCPQPRGQPVPKPLPPFTPLVSHTPGPSAWRPQSAAPAPPLHPLPRPPVATRACPPAGPTRPLATSRDSAWGLCSKSHGPSKSPSWGLPVLPERTAWSLLSPPQ